MCKKNDFTKAGKPRSWKGQNAKIKDLEENLSVKESELKLCKESYAKEIDRLKLSITDHEKTIKKQAQEITRLTGSVTVIKADRDQCVSMYEKMMKRSLWERIMNKEVDA